MNRTLEISALIAFSAILTFAQSEQPEDTSPMLKFSELMFGPRVSVGLNNFSSGYSEVDKEFGITTGFGVGAGIALSIPIKELTSAGSLSFNPELNLLYRKLYGYTDPGIAVEFEKDEYQVDATEFAVSVPALIRFTPNAKPFFLAAGFQLDIPFKSEFVFVEKDRGASLEVKERSGVDFGLVLGAGYNITSRLSADIRWVKGLTTTLKESEDKSSYDQFTAGIAYLFSLPKPKPKPKSKPKEAVCPVCEAPKQEEDDRLESFQGKSIEVYKDKRGTILSMSDILFESGKANLKDELKMNLTELAGILKSFLTESYIVVEGHTDNVGTAEYNQTLSEQRANAVMQYLAGRGVNLGKLSSVGYGLTRPIADNSTEEGRAKNRRVELVITREPPKAQTQPQPEAKLEVKPEPQPEPKPEPQPQPEPEPQPEAEPEPQPEVKPQPEPKQPLKFNPFNPFTEQKQ